MITTTTPTIAGHDITAYYGIVTGEAILGANVFRDLFASIRDLVGGRSAAYEQELSKARDIAMQEMKDRASEMGANAVLAVDIDYETITINNGGSMLMVSVSGTAVSVQRS